VRDELGGRFTLSSSVTPESHYPGDDPRAREEHCVDCVERRIAVNNSLEPVDLHGIEQRIALLPPNLLEVIDLRPVGRKVVCRSASTEKSRRNFAAPK
jgi:hypothetical protein